MVSGASGFIVKDAPADQLTDAIRRVHAGLRVVNPEWLRSRWRPATTR
jgi:two-component system response regulator DesR